jgi:prophage antirepressor-like protein
MNAPTPANPPAVFSFDSHAVRTLLIDDQPWFVAADVCEALEMSNVTMALKRLDDDEQALSSIEGISRGNDQANIINESGLYNLVLGSRKPSAKRFKKWVTAEVLPAIRKTGRYEAKPYATNPADKLTKDEADTLRRMMKEGVEKLPKEKWAGASIAGWSKLKSHFGVPYREIPRSEFCEAVSLVARHVAEYQALAAPTAAAPIGDAIKAAITEAVKQAVDAKMLPAPAQAPAMKLDGKRRLRSACLL